MPAALIDNGRVNNPSDVRLVQDGRILLGAYGISAPTGTTWDPASQLTAGTRTDIGYYSEDGFSLTPEPGDNKQFKAHNEDVVIDQDGPGTWAVAFSGLEQKKQIIEAYFDAVVNTTDGSITLSKASVDTFRDLVTVGIAGTEVIISHYPRVKVTDREALTYNPGTINAYGLTFRAFKDPILGYQLKQWSTFLIEAAAAIPTIGTVSPATTQAAAGNVVITGTGFGTVSGADGVKFGADNAASYHVDSPTQITAIMPAGSAGSANIVVKNSGGNSTAKTYARS
ncbi:MAG: IPT/TIG domain-containing protein [Mycetocola sp.]